MTIVLMDRDHRSMSTPKALTFGSLKLNAKNNRLTIRNTSPVHCPISRSGVVVGLELRRGRVPLWKATLTRPRKVRPKDVVRFPRGHIVVTDV